MLQAPLFEVHEKSSSSYRVLPPMQSLSNTMPTNLYENARYDDYLYSRHYQSRAVGSVVPQSIYGPDNSAYEMSSRAAHVTGSSHAYNLANANLLPPPQVSTSTYTESQRGASKGVPAKTQQHMKDEKVGGVAAHLDYRMDEMVNFVSEMSQGMYGIFTSKLCLADIDMTRSVMSSKIAVHPDFRRYVHQVLTSTRLPSSTILLGLHYLAVRMTILSSRGNYSYGGGEVYGLLTTALLLGSKFLDDNTFQNRSWSDVSNISVKKLNGYETEWLQDINWDMHFDVSDPKGFALWRRRWQSFQNAPVCKNVDFLVDTLEKTSIDTTVSQQQSSYKPTLPLHRYASQYTESSSVSHYIDHSTQQWHAPHHESWKYAQRDAEYSPPSAPETGPNTPEYTISNNFEYSTLSSAYPSLKMPAPLHILPSNGPAAAYSAPQYNQYAGHGSYCGCGYCVAQGERYLANYTFDQAVAG